MLKKYHGDLDQGMEWAADTFGVAAAYGGEHIGMGTRNALMSLGSTYLEIIAPDPAQEQVEGSMGAKFSALSEGGMVTWAAEGDLHAIVEKLGALDVSTHGPNRTQRKTQSGDVLIWDLLFPIGSAHGGRMPFFIDWLECTNPKDTNPKAGDFQTLAISTENAADLSGVLGGIGLDLSVKEGAPGVSVHIDTSKGEVVLASTAETAAISMR